MFPLKDENPTEITPYVTLAIIVANVAVWGRRARQLQVQVKPDTLRSNGLTLNQIVTATGDALWVSPLSYLEASTAGTGGWIETPNQRLAIQHVQPISTPKDLAQVAIAGTPMRLGNVAKVVEEHPLLRLIQKLLIGQWKWDRACYSSSMRR